MTVCTVVKSKGKILQNFVAFSECMNFKIPKQKTYLMGSAISKWLTSKIHSKCTKYLAQIWRGYVIHCPIFTRVQNIWGFSPLVLSKREKNILVLLSLYIFWEKCVYFSIFNAKKNSQLWLFWHNCESYHSKIEK